jgi:hypothetical protein
MLDRVASAADVETVTLRVPVAAAGETANVAVNCVELETMMVDGSTVTPAPVIFTDVAPLTKLNPVSRTVSVVPGDTDEGAMDGSAG